VAWIDIASDRVTELDSTRTSAPIAGPRWSPDGTRILYSASGKFNGDNVVYVVDIGGGSLHRVNPSALPARSAGWSPDGNLIVFSSFDDRTVGVPGDGEHAALVRDIYTIRPDGTGLQQLTTDGVSRGGSWTPDGRILFVRVPLDSANSPTGDPSSGFWTIAADGGDLQQVPDSSTAITPDTYFDDALAFWQPKP
jgi:Tol biopolymer transport system component